MAAKKNQRPCFMCDGTGLKCNGCGESESVCAGDCEDEPCGHSDCGECDGTGVASADRGDEPGDLVLA